MKTSTAKRSLAAASLAIGVLLTLSALVFNSNAKAAVGPALNLNNVPAAAANIIGANWPQADGNALGQNYNPQTVINSQNAQSLGVNWIFPIPAAPASVAAVLGAGTEGPGGTPFVVNGVVYFVTQYNTVFALDAIDGHAIWSTNLPVSVNASIKALWFIGALDHYHNGMTYFTNTVLTGGPLLWIGTNQYQVFALDANSGKIMVAFSSYLPGEKCAGCFGIIAKANSPGVVIDEKRGLMFTDINGGSTGGTRGLFKAWDISHPWVGMATGTRPPAAWVNPIIPPQDGSDPNWSLNSVNNMKYAWSFNSTAAIDLKALPQSQLQSILKNDWGDMGYNGTYGMDTAGGSWGGAWVVDSAKGILYAGSDDVSPYYSVGHRPGPNLWATSIFAMNETTGQFIWGFNQAAHDQWDRDCSWGVTYAPGASILGQTKDVILKGCKSGYVFALDANTGQMLWYFYPPNVPIYALDRLHDIRNSSQMNLPWSGACSQAAAGKCIGPYNNGTVLWHCSSTGCLEADITYDPSTNMVYIPSAYSPQDNVPNANAFTSPKQADEGVTSKAHGESNATIYAVDVSTGKIAWSYFIPHQAYRGGVTVSGGVVYVTTPDGIFRLLNAKTGALIVAIPEGGPLRQQPAVGADVNGVMKVFLEDGAPGAILALALPSSALAGPSTTTVTSTSVSTIPGGVTTVTTTAPGGGVTTITSTATGSTGGIDPTTFYAVAGVAAILAIGMGALLVRGRKGTP